MKAEKFIVYACPVGELYQQVDLFFQKSRQYCGDNPAHRYMPHCSLTGFFEEQTSRMTDYISALDKAYFWSQNTDVLLDIKVLKMTFKPRWHGLELEAVGVQKMMNHFVESAPSPTGSTLRLKQGLHLSFAYQFNPEQSQTLKQLAQEIINPKAQTQWELRFYQKHPDWTWTCHQSWVL